MAIIRNHAPIFFIPASTHKHTPQILYISLGTAVSVRSCYQQQAKSENKKMPLFILSVSLFPSHRVIRWVGGDVGQSDGAHDVYASSRPFGSSTKTTIPWCLVVPGLARNDGPHNGGGILESFLVFLVLAVLGDPSLTGIQGKFMTRCLQVACKDGAGRASRVGPTSPAVPIFDPVSGPGLLIGLFTCCTSAGTVPIYGRTTNGTLIDKESDWGSWARILNGIKLPYLACLSWLLGSLVGTLRTDTSTSHEPLSEHGTSKSIGKGTVRKGNH